MPPTRGRKKGSRNSKTGEEVQEDDYGFTVKKNAKSSKPQFPIDNNIDCNTY
jgi:hypothetical protein